jgi:hypothetical protein
MTKGSPCPALSSLFAIYIYTHKCKKQRALKYEHEKNKEHGGKSTKLKVQGTKVLARGQKLSSVQLCFFNSA